MKTIITLSITHDSPQTVEFVKQQIFKLVQRYMNSNQIAVWHENK